MNTTTVAPSPYEFERGVCVHCGEPIAISDWFDIEYDDDLAYFPYRCSKCGTEGVEVQVEVCHYEFRSNEYR